METRVIPLSDLQADPEGVLRACCDSGQTLIIELPGLGRVAIHRIDADEEDDLINRLIAQDGAFRELLARSLASPREPFPFVPE